jgi:hypothetical protein
MDLRVVSLKSREFKGFHCVLCGEILANEALKPAKFHRYMQSNILRPKNKLSDYFQRQSGTLKAQ